MVKSKSSGCIAFRDGQHNWSNPYLQTGAWLPGNHRRATLRPRFTNLWTYLRKNLL